MRALAASAALLLAACTVSIGAPPDDGRPAAPAPAPRPAPRPAPQPAAPPPTAPAPAPQPVPAGSRAEQMAALVNRHRIAAGCPQLTWLPGAARAAEAHAEDMARRDYFSHVSPEGEGFPDRLAREGVSLHMGAENIALDPGSPAEVLSGWLRSPGHRQNLENCRYTHHGIGEHTGRWTHVLLAPGG